MKRRLRWTLAILVAVAAVIVAGVFLSAVLTVVMAAKTFLAFVGGVLTVGFILAVLSTVVMAALDWALAKYLKLRLRRRPIK